MWKKGGGKKWGGEQMVMVPMSMLGSMWGGKGWGKGGKGGKGGPKPKLGKGSKKKLVKPTPKDESGGVLGTFTGKLAKAGYKFGFLESAELKTQGYDQIFVFWDEMQDVVKDQKVKFTCFIDAQGKAQAKNLKPA